MIRYGDDPLIRGLYPADQWNWIEPLTQANRVRGEVWIRRTQESSEPNSPVDI